MGFRLGCYIFDKCNGRTEHHGAECQNRLIECPCALSRRIDQRVTLFQEQCVDFGCVVLWFFRHGPDYRPVQCSANPDPVRCELDRGLPLVSGRIVRT